jgi:hypothetical protein
MSVERALIAAADAVARGDYPYVYGGGHAEAGTASIGIKGPGYNGRRVGFDCSGSVAAVLAGAGRSLTLVVTDPRVLDWTSMGDAVQVTYTPDAHGALTVRAVDHTTAVSPPST